MIKKWLSDQYTNLDGTVLSSRDVLYLTNRANPTEQYIYPLANICSISFKFAMDCMPPRDRQAADIAPLDLLLVLETVRHDKQLFVCRYYEMRFDYYGFDK